MASTLSRLSEASATSLICSGRLSSPAKPRSALGSIFHPNLVAMTTLALWSERFAHQFFVHVRAVNFGGVKECDAAFHGGTQNRGHFLLVFRWAIGKAHSHAAEPDGRNFQIAFSKFALLHCFS